MCANGDSSECEREKNPGEHLRFVGEIVNVQEEGKNWISCFTRIYTIGALDEIRGKCGAPGVRMEDKMNYIFRTISDYFSMNLKFMCQGCRRPSSPRIFVVILGHHS